MIFTAIVNMSVPNTPEIEILPVNATAVVIMLYKDRVDISVTRYTITWRMASSSGVEKNVTVLPTVQRFIIDSLGKSYC